ncbi:hypothetical protein A0J61_00507 [Choanephora cucurbitarum]|uniref:GATA-type domain-containing protein n=1 Tax=Choanephora cucurbitarum TaxID=101091 RepID=A0A1C7NQP3_9FUNG|nr:hypothetical protein A0J61_00507 [Choanephora cucurbitarum]
MSCYWALLSLETFKYIYLPSNVRDILMTSDVSMGDIPFTQSLFDYIHPEESYLATNDLSNFVRRKTLSGAVTRCRFLTIQSIIRQQKKIQKNSSSSNEAMDWAVTDLVMYNATDKIVLTFFHTLCIDATDHHFNCCGSPEIGSNEINYMKTVLRQYHTTSPLHPLCLFQIHDTLKQHPLLTYHSVKSNDQIETNFMRNVHSMIHEITLQEIKRRRRNDITNQPTCTQPAQSTTTQSIPPYDSCRVESIVIVYGHLTFSLIQVVPHCLDNQSKTILQPDLPFSFQNNPTSLLYHSSSPKQFISNQLNKTIVEGERISHSSPVISHNRGKSWININSRFQHETSFLPKIWRGRFGIHEKRCKNCDTSKSPEWRRGPNGHKTLCNACGLRYARLMAKHEKKT